MGLQWDGVFSELLEEPILHLEGVAEAFLSSYSMSVRLSPFPRSCVSEESGLCSSVLNVLYSSK